MSGLKFLYNLILKDVAKGSGQASGILSIGSDVRKIAMNKYAKFVDSAKKQGVDLDKLSEQEIKYMLELNKPKPIKAIPADSPEGQGITRDLFNMLDRRSGKNVIKTDFGKPFAEEVITVDSVIKNIKTMKPMDSMKETNKVLKGEGQYKNLSKADREKIASDESVTDHIFERNIEPDPEDMADGGVAGMLDERIGFKLGGINKARRLFLQAIGAGTAGIGAAKTGLFSLLKGVGKKDLTSIPIENAEGMPSWFKPLVNRVIKEGIETTNLPPNKGGAYLNRQIVHSAKLGENQGVRVYQNLDDQTIDVVYKSADNMGGVDDGVVTLEYRAPRDIYDTGPASVMSKEYQATKKASGQYPKKSAAEFEAHEAYPYQDPEDYKSITFEAKHIKSNVDDLFSDTSALKQFGTNKTLTKKELEIAKQKRKQVKKINEDPYGEELAGSGPSYDDYYDYADGGVAGLLGERPGYKSGLSVLDKTLAVASVPYNFGKGIIGNVSNPGALTQVSLTNAQKDYLDNIAQLKGPSGTIDYSDYGGPTKTFSGISGMNPMQASLATTMGGTGYSTNPDGSINYTGGTYDFNKGNVITDFIDKGGILGAADRLGKNIYDAVNPEEEDEYDFSDIEGQTAGLGILSGIKGALSKFVGPKAAAFIVKRGKDKIRSDIGEKVIAPTIKKIKNKKITTRPSSGGGRDRSFDTSRADRAGTSLGSGQFSPQTSRGRSGYTEGGVAGLLDKRQNFAMGRRAFLKLMGNIGAGIGAAKAGLGSLFKAGKPVTKAAEVITTPNAPGKPEWFDALVTRVIREGDDVTKKFATKEREIVHTTKIDENATVTVTRDLDEGTVRVDIDDPTTNVADDQGNAIVSMEVKGGRLEEGVKGKTPAEFEAVETDYGNYMTTPDDFITEAVENTVSNTKDLTADLTKVKMYAKGQKKPTIKEMMIQRERARDLKLAEENPAEYASGRQPDIDYSDYDADIDYSDYDDYASGGIAKMLGE